MKGGRILETELQMEMETVTSSILRFKLSIVGPGLTLDKQPKLPRTLETPILSSLWLESKKRSVCSRVLKKIYDL